MVQRLQKVTFSQASCPVFVSYDMVIMRQTQYRIMWKILITLILAVAVCQFGFAETEGPMVVVFYKEGCPDCQRLDELLDALLAQHEELTIAHYEITEPDSQELLSRLSFAYGILDTNYPIVFVGDEAFVGVSRAKELRVRSAIVECISRNCPSPLSHLKETGLSWNHVFLLVGLALFLLLLLLPQQE